MNLATIQMPATQAREKVAEYLKAVRQRHTAEDAAILAGYRALASGKALIDLPETISAGGVDGQGRPMLAVCRADAQRVFMRRDAAGGVRFSMAVLNTWGRWQETGVGERGGNSHGARVRLRAGTLPAAEWNKITNEAIARVPLIPPSLRPAGSLVSYHILWEADWEKAPVDPALLKHIGGDLWAVCAVWDLTPLEQKVLMGR